MIMVGLKYDFLDGEEKLIIQSLSFCWNQKNPKYKIRGFIDKPIVYKRGKKVKIVDYKSSKYKFRGEELHSNVQAMTYTLAAKKHWRDLSLRQNFLFLRFPKSPIQQ